MAAYNHHEKEILAPFEFMGYTDTHLFNGWFETVLCPQLKEGQVIIMDNARFHKSPEIIDMANKVGCSILFLPPYSPDLNPIEKVWANTKAKVRKIIKECASLEEAITYAFNTT